MGSLTEGFAAAVRAFPTRVAVRDGSRSVTYRELDARARALSAALRCRGAQPGRPVGILLERSADMVASALAVLRTGAPYVPLDPASPRARLELILEHAAPPVVITTRDTGRLPGGPTVIRTDAEVPPVPQRPEPAAAVGREAPAYLLFPPGTTGRPRRVQVSHGSVLRLFAEAERRYGFGSEDIWALSHSCAPDVWAWQMWGALLYGGCALVVPQEAAEDPRALHELLRAERVTVHLSRSPAAFERLIAEDARAGDPLPLKCVVFGGQAPHAPALEPWKAAHGDESPQLITLAGAARAAAGTEPFALAPARDLERLPPAAGIEDAYPLSTLQARLLPHGARSGSTATSCDLFMFRLAAPYDHDALTRAVSRAIARHDILRTSFHFGGYSQPLQLVHRGAGAEVGVRDLRPLPWHRRDAELAAWPGPERSRPYDWAKPPLARFHALLVEDEEFVFCIGFPDALLDRRSESSLITEILSDFWALRDGGRKPPVPRPAHRFADCVARERQALDDPLAREFWSRELAGLRPTLLPQAGGPAAAREGRTLFGGVDITPGRSEALDAVARKHDACLRHVLLAVHARALAALTGRDEVVLAVESDDRPEEGGTRAIGIQLNVVPYRLPVGGRGWGELIRAVQDKERELAAAPHLPYATAGRLAGLREVTDVIFAHTDFHGFEELVAATELELLDAKTRVHTGTALRVEFTKDPFTQLLGLDLEADGRRVDGERLREVEDVYRETLACVVDAERGSSRPPHSSGTR
ncbi:AMP-binding protein [Streptomyces sp. NPDC026206]|uniref:AMP-binding protein n=1 Tax=Streptomyces sp. NPDC026206 TaxID=3157089 RepID=UPI0033C6AC31